MKKLIFAIIAAFFAIQTSAQTVSREYVSLEECYYDPLLYIEQNYIHNIARHQNQTVLDFAQEFELPVQPSQVWPVTYSAGVSGGGNDVTQNGNCIGFVLDFYYEDLEAGQIKYSMEVKIAAPHNQNWNDPSSPIYRLSDEEVTWDQYKEMFGNNRIVMIWVYKKLNGQSVTKTYERARLYQ